MGRGQNHPKKLDKQTKNFFNHEIPREGGEGVSWSQKGYSMILHFIYVNLRGKICEKKCYVPEIIDKEIGQSLSTCTYKESFSIRDDTSSIRNGFKVAIVLLNTNWLPNNNRYNCSDIGSKIDLLTFRWWREWWLLYFSQVQFLSNRNETHVYILKWNYLKPCDISAKIFYRYFHYYN